MAYRIPPLFRPYWKRAIHFIAFNDGDGDNDALDFRHVKGMVSVVAIAETFGVHTEKVARAVVSLRRKAEGKTK